MLLKWPPKDPDEVLDYGIDWTARLAGDEIISSSWIIIPDEVTMNSNTYTETSTTIWLSGGTLGSAPTITNRIVTAGGRTMDQSVILKIRDK